MLLTDDAFCFTTNSAAGGRLSDQVEIYMRDNCGLNFDIRRHWRIRKCEGETDGSLLLRSYTY